VESLIHPCEHEVEESLTRRRHGKSMVKLTIPLGEFVPLISYNPLPFKHTLCGCTSTSGTAALMIL